MKEKSDSILDFFNFFNMVNNGKAEEYENRRTTGKNMLEDNIINIIPANEENFQIG